MLLYELFVLLCDYRFEVTDNRIDSACCNSAKLSSSFHFNLDLIHYSVWLQPGRVHCNVLVGMINYFAVFFSSNKISVILYFSVGLLSLFFLPHCFVGRLLTDLHKIWHDRDVLHACDFNRRGGFSPLPSHFRSL